MVWGCSGDSLGYQGRDGTSIVWGDHALSLVWHLLFLTDLCHGTVSAGTSLGRIGRDPGRGSHRRIGLGLCPTRGSHRCDHGRPVMGRGSAWRENNHASRCAHNTNNTYWTCNPTLFCYVIRHSSDEALYFTLVTMTTIGYGDFYPTCRESQSHTVPLFRAQPCPKMPHALPPFLPDSLSSRLSTPCGPASTDFLVLILSYSYGPRSEMTAPLRLHFASSAVMLVQINLMLSSSGVMLVLIIFMLFILWEMIGEILAKFSEMTQYNAGTASGLEHHPRTYP